MAMDNYGVEIIERIQLVLKAKNVSLNSFAASCNIGRSTFSSQIQKKTVSINFVYAILYTYRDVSPAWILFGEGSMFSGRNTVALGDASKVQELETEVEFLKAQVEIMRRQNEALTLQLAAIMTDQGKEAM